MKHIYYIFISLCMSLFTWSCKDSEEIAPASLTINKNELSFTGYKSTLAVKVNATRRWSAVASEYWITISPDNYPGVNESFIANVAVTVSDNATGQPREGHVTFFLQDEEVITLTVKQSIQDEGERPDEEFPITWANLQWCASSVINEGDDFEAGSCVFADGITNSVDSETGEEITNPDETTKAELEKIRNTTNEQLKMSDLIQTGDLLRFYTGNDLGKVNPKDYSYTNALKSLLSIEKKKGDESTSLYSKRGGNSTVDLFNSPSYRALHPEQFESTSNGSSSSTEESSSSSK